MIILNLLNRIFGHRGSLSRDEISSYQKKESQHDVEEKSLTDDFDSDALDGWTENNIPIEKMSDLDKKFQTKFGTTIWSSGTIFFFVFFFLVSGIILIFTYTSNKTNEILIAGDKTESNMNKQPKSGSINTILKEEERAINDFQTVSKEKEVQPSSLKRSNTIVNSENADTLQEEIVQYIPHISPEVQNNIPVEEKSRTLIYSMVDEFYLHDFKLIDYRKFRDSPIKNKKLVPVGTPANQEYYEDENQEDFVWQDVDIPYVDYLDETMGYFEKSKYKKALKRFNIILDTYEEDVNAHFYGGLCYYNLGQYEKAVTHFDNSYNIKFGNFRQEAQWFKAKALLELNKIESAKELLNRIISENKFYAKEAQKLINEVNQVE